MAQKQRWQEIPTVLTESQFNKFVLPHLTKGLRGPPTKLTFYELFNYILKLMHTGCQWKEVPIKNDPSGKPEIHYTNIFRVFKRWVYDSCFEKIFIGSVSCLFTAGLLDTTVIHGDGTTTAAKKGAII
jgi:hypothetical protein